jgi:hypothetical protein
MKAQTGCHRHPFSLLQVTISAAGMDLLVNHLLDGPKLNFNSRVRDAFRNTYLCRVRAGNERNYFER